MSVLPIGVFDSGVGGFTVLSQLRERMPQEHFLYLGDTARLPYGTKSPETVARYALRAAAHLADEQVKAIVVACNTASAVALPHLQAAYPDIPIFGVVEPGAVAAAGAWQQGCPSAGILVLATASTVSGGAYQRALLSQQSHARIYARCCPLWVTLAEVGPQPATFVASILDNDLRGFDDAQVSTILLGCTHFPVFLSELEQRYPQFSIVDSASTTAAFVAAQLAQVGLLRTEGCEGSGQTRFLATDDARRFARVGRYFLTAANNNVSLGDELLGALDAATLVDLERQVRVDA